MAEPYFDYTGLAMRTLLLFLLITPGSALAQADHTQQCSKVADLALPQEADIPKPAAFPACEAYKSYAGIGRPVNYAAARACAWKERAAQLAALPQNPKAATSWAIGGDLILIDLYTNGLGTPRNLPLALHLACEENSGIAGDAIDALDALDALSKAPQPTAKQSSKRFEVCDSAYSTLSMNFCGDYQSQVVEVQRNRAFARIAADWTAPQKSAFAKVRAAEEEYVKVHVGELDQGGTIHGMRDLGSMEIMRNNFLLDLRQFENGTTARDQNAAAVESRMKKQYEENLAAARAPVSETESGTAVTAGSVTKTQAAWQRYRDAWLAFAALRYPSVSAAAFRAYFADQRYRLLVEMRKQIYRG